MTGRPPFSFFLIDFPSDHEVDDNLSTECETVRAILNNRGFKCVTKTTRLSSLERLNSMTWRAYPKIGYVHLAAHGTKRGIELIGGDMRWSEVAKRLKLIAPRLSAGQKRV